MEANQYALVHGMARTKLALARWRQDPRPVLLGWFAGALAISALLLLAVWAIASAIPPDLGFDYLPARPHGPEAERVLALVGRNSIVLALHAFACIAGFIAGSALPLSAERRSGLSRWIHERAKPVAFAWVIAVTTFSLITQAFALGVYGSTLAASANVSVTTLLLTVAPHALLELTAVFLPLAAWTMASRRDDWDQLLAATAVTVTLAIPMLFASAIWEVHVWPYLLRAASGGV
jgi:hypothetical protein